jgi:Ca-activated chloride channel family protein
VGLAWERTPLAGGVRAPVRPAGSGRAQGEPLFQVPLLITPDKTWASDVGLTVPRVNSIIADLKWGKAMLQPTRAMSTLLVVLCGLTGLVLPQSSPQTTPSQQSDVRLGTIGVNLSVAVLDKRGRLITDLRVGNFEIKEDGERQQVVSFSKENELPLSLGVLMDASNSVRPKLKFEKDAAMNFLDAVVRRGKDSALFVIFNSKVELLQDFTDNLEDLRDAIYSVKAGGPTALYDSVYRVCQEKMPTANGRRAIIAVSDGEDTASRHTLEDAIEIAQRTETVVYCVGTNNAGFFGVKGGISGTEGDKDLKRLAEETGGRAFFPTEVLELEKTFTEIGQELRSQYILFYVSSNQRRDGRFRDIDVKIVGRDGMRVRAKRGYTAPFGDAKF